MAKVQSRRSISFGRADFDAAQEAAARLKIPLAQLAGQALREFLARNPEVADIGPSRPVAAQAVVDDLRVGSPFRAPCQLMGCAAAIGQACRPVPTLEGEPDPELAVGSAHKNRTWAAVPDPVPSPSPSGSVYTETRDLGFTTVDAVAAQRMIDGRVGVLPRAGRLTVADIRRTADRLVEAANQAPRDPDGDVLLPIAPGSILDRMIEAARHPKPFNQPDCDQISRDQLSAILSEDLRVDHIPVQILRGPLPETWAEISGVTPVQEGIDQLIENSSVGAGLRNIEENGLEAELEDLEQDMTDHPDAGEVRVVYDEE